MPAENLTKSFVFLMSKITAVQLHLVRITIITSITYTIKMKSERLTM